MNTRPPVTLETLAAVRDQALTIGVGLLGPARHEIADALVPTAEDFAALFTESVAARVHDAYVARFPSAPRMEPGPGQTDVRVVTCPSEAMAIPSPLRDGFPGGYASLAPFLAPGVVWAVLRFVVPGDSHGMAYDGLAWLDRGFVWVPKPWKLLPDFPPA